MKFAPLIFALTILTNTALSQSREESRYQAKVAKPFASFVAWEREFETARTKAKARKELPLIFAYFTRSYAP